MPDPSPELQRLHDDSVRRREAGYFDPASGLFVMNAATLKARGRCCGSGCRHCPWPAEEQRRAGRPGA